MMTTDCSTQPPLPSASTKGQRGAVFVVHPEQYPTTPGVYLFRGPGDEVLYVGKAKNLRRRLLAYRPDAPGLSLKTQAMLRRAVAVETVCTATEKEALLLEASLIKAHRPKYNIVLRDDKNYLLFAIDHQHPYPTLRTVRRVRVSKHTSYFGPYTSAGAARQTRRIIDGLFLLRKCRDTVFANRVRPCLQYHIGRCLGPCCLDVPREEYAAIVRQVELFLSGKSGELLSRLRQEMHQAAQALQFERAAQLRDQIRAIEATVEGQSAVLPGEHEDLDVWAAVEGERGLGIAVLFVRQGRVLGANAFRLTAAALQEALQAAVLQFYTGGRLVSSVLVTAPALPGAFAEALTEVAGHPVRLRSVRGERMRGLVRMAEANARQAQQVVPPAVRWERVVGPNRDVRRIEAVDVSHLHGQGVRAGMVVFEDGAAVPSAYRHYLLPAAEGRGDDLMALRLWAERRRAAGPPWPDLLLVDGGQGQVAAVAPLFEDLGVPVLGLAKGPSRRAGELEDRVYLPGRKNPLPLRPGSPELLLLQRVRDAAHRFVLAGQRQGRRQGLISALESLPGVGPATARQLRQRFHRVAELAQATEADLIALGLSPQRARAVLAAAQEAVSTANGASVDAMYRRGEEA